MRVIQATATVESDHTLTLRLPPEVPLGEHHVVLVIDDPISSAPQREPLKFSNYNVGIRPETFTFRREEIYGDDGR